MKNLFIFSILLISTSCSTLQHDVSKPVIQLTKKRCLGKCPVYDLMIYQNGLVTYNRIDHVQKKGLHQFNLGSQKVEELTQLFESSGFSSMENKQQKGRNLPVTQLTYQQKQLSFKGRVPKQLNDVVVALERIVAL